MGWEGSSHARRLCDRLCSPEKQVTEKEKIERMKRYAPYVTDGRWVIFANIWISHNTPSPTVKTEL